MSTINRENAIEAIKEKAMRPDIQRNADTVNGLLGAMNIIYDLPTTEKVGMWIDKLVYKQTMDGKTWDGYTYCSECREMHEYGYRSNYCPNCGAKMVGGEEDEAD